MKAIRVHEFGGPEKLVYEEDVPEPAAGPGQVLLGVRASGVNFADYLARIGAYARRDLPMIPGFEAAGIVEVVGPDVESPRVGEGVMALCESSYAELALATARKCLPIPSGLSFEQAAAIPTAFSTAWHALVALARVEAGERVLIHAASSGVSSAAIQVAKARGAWVATTSSQDWKLEKARELGADATINYQTEDFVARIQELTGGRGVHVVGEGVGKATFPGSVNVLALGGRMAIWGSPSGPRVELDTRLAIARGLIFYGLSILSDTRFPDSLDDFRRNGLTLFESGALRPVVHQVLPLREAAEAHRSIQEQTHFGKIVLKVSG